MTIARFSTVPCSEVFGSRRERVGRNGRWSVVTTLECDWDLRWNLIQDLYTSGLSQYTSNPENDPYPYRPRAFPDPPGGLDAAGQGTKLGFKSVTNLTYGRTFYDGAGNNQVIDAKIARITVEYDRYYDVEETLEWQTQFLRVNPLNLEWAGGATPGDPPAAAFTGDDRQVKPEEAPGFPYHTAIFTRNYIGLSNDWIVDLPTYIGTTNDGSYISQQLGITFQPQTLLMLNPRVKPAINLTGLNTATEPFNSGFEVTLRFLYKEEGHNKFWRPNVTSNKGVTGVNNPSAMRGYWDYMVVKIGESGNGYEPYWPFLANQKLNSVWLKGQNPPVALPAQ